MVMRLKADPETGGFFAACDDGTIVRATAAGSSLATIAEKLPPAYDLAIIP